MSKTFSLVSVHSKVHESPRGAIIREYARGKYKLEQGKFIIYIYILRQITNYQRIDFFFKFLKWEGKIKILEPNKCDEID